MITRVFFMSIQIYFTIPIFCPWINVGYIYVPTRKGGNMIQLVEDWEKWAVSKVISLTSQFNALQAFFIFGERERERGVKEYRAQKIKRKGEKRQAINVEYFLFHFTNQCSTSLFHFWRGREGKGVKEYRAQERVRGLLLSRLLTFFGLFSEEESYQHRKRDKDKR